jgi:hypothetical protein
VFAALEVATGTVTDRCYDRHGKAEFLDFLKLVARTYPRRRLHVVLDNYHTTNTTTSTSGSRRTRVKQLVAAIRAFIDAYNDRCQPFVWTKTADDMQDTSS